jgi:hypothetical protein
MKYYHDDLVYLSPIDLPHGVIEQPILVMVPTLMMVFMRTVDDLIVVEVIG